LKPPPAGRLRRANLHRLHSIDSSQSTYINQPSSFVAHLFKLEGERDTIFVL